MIKAGTILKIKCIQIHDTWLLKSHQSVITINIDEFSTIFILLVIVNY